MSAIKHAGSNLSTSARDARIASSNTIERSPSILCVDCAIHSMNLYVMHRELLVLLINLSLSVCIQKALLKSPHPYNGSHNRKIYSNYNIYIRIYTYINTSKKRNYIKCCNSVLIDEELENLQFCLSI